MAKGRTVAVRITADTKGLAAGVMRAEVTLGNLRKTSVAAAAVLGKALVAGGVAATAALAALYVRTSQQIDATAKLADRLGMTTDALSALQFQADLSGVASETLNKSLEKMSMTIGDAITKGGAAADSFERLGLSAHELAKLPADQQLSKIADSISKMDSAAEQAAAANAIFGRSGQEMLNILRDGSAGIEDARKKADAYGVTLSRVDAAKVEAANDAWDESQQVLTGIANRITVKLAPVVEAVLKLFNDAALESNGFGQAIDTAFTKAVKVVGFFADTVHGLRVVFKAAELSVFTLEASVFEVFKAATDIIATSLEGWLGLFDMVIDQVNDKFGKNFAKFEFKAEDSPFVKAVADISEISQNHIVELAAELQAMAMQELPSEKIERFVAAVQEASQKAAESVAQSRAAMFGAGGTGEVDDETKKKIEAFNKTLLTEEEAELASHQKRLAELELYRQQQLDIGMSYDEAERRINQDHKDSMVEIERRALETIAGFRAASFRQQAASTAGFFKNMTANVATASKTMFNINKTAAIAEGILNLKEAVMGAYKWGANRGGPALGAISAGIAGAAQVAQLNAIKNQQFGGGGGVAPSVGPTPAPPVTPVGGGSGGGAGGSSQQTVFLQGIDPNSLFSGSQMIDVLNLAIKDGKRLVLA